MSKPVLKRSLNDEKAIEKGVELIPANVDSSYEIREDEKHLYHVLETSKIHLANEQKYEDSTRLVKLNQRAWASALNTIERKGGNARKLIHDPTSIGNAPQSDNGGSDDNGEGGEENKKTSSVAEIVAAIAEADSVEKVDELLAMKEESVKVKAAAEARKEELAN